MIEAKTIVPNQYWILREHDRKIGNIEAEPGGYAINLNGETVKVKSLDMLTGRVPITFQTVSAKSEPEPTNQVHGYPTTHPPYNSVFNVQHQLPLWTREQYSRSWVAAGWYRVQQHRDWQVMLCPKLILLQRYTHQGPFYTQEEARSA